MLASVVILGFIAALIAAFCIPVAQAGADHGDRHPADSAGNYIPAGDNKLRIGRLLLVSDQDIAWYREGDIILDRNGALRKIVRVDCVSCVYRLETAGVNVPEWADPIPFETALHINGFPKRG